MALYFIYRVNGGEVLSVSVDSQSPLPSSYLGEIQDPKTPNGSDLSSPKIYDGSQVRNATAQEISNFSVAAAQDEAMIARESSAKLMDLGLNGIIHKSIVQNIVDEINILRGWIMDFKAQVAASTNLANLQSRVASLDNLPDRTYTQARNAIKTAINSGTND